MNLHDPDHYVFQRNSRLPRDTFKRREYSAWIADRIVLYLSIAIIVSACMGWIA